MEQNHNNERSPVAHVRTAGGIVRMDRAEVDANNANVDNEKFEVVADDHADVKALYAPKAGQPIPVGGVPEGVTVPPLAPAGQPVPGSPSMTPAMQTEATWANPETDKVMYVMQIGSRWFVTNDKGHRFQKGQSAAGYATQEEANGQAQKMQANVVPATPDGTTAPPADQSTIAGGAASQ